jgi:hypothetical protein
MEQLSTLGVPGLAGLDRAKLLNSRQKNVTSSKIWIWDFI